MDTTGEDLKPTLTADNILDETLTIASGVSTLKQSRYEDVWPEDVHAAFMEAVALYPPMGKRRLKYYRVSTRENDHLSDANRAKSFGRCQLIQSYILEKTGKNRSRKQVSSHLQRLKKIHKNDPTMHPLFSERSQPPSDYCAGPQVVATSSEDTLTNVPLTACNLKSDIDISVNHQNTDIGINNSSTFLHLTGVPFLNTGSCSAFELSASHHDQSCFFSRNCLSSQQPSAGTQYRTDGEYISEPQDPLLLKDALNGGFRVGPAFDTSAFAKSMRRLALKLPTQNRQADLVPMTHFSRIARSPGFQPTHQWIARCDEVDDTSCNSQLHSAGPFHTPFYSLHSIPFDKHRFEPDLPPDRTWPQNRDTSLDSREGISCEVRLQCPLAMHQYNPACPEVKDYYLGSHGFPAEGEVSRGVPCSYALPSPASASVSVSKESDIDFSWLAMPESPRDLTSPLVIRPTPVYPISYVHSDGHNLNLPP